MNLRLGKTSNLLASLALLLSTSLLAKDVNALPKDCHGVSNEFYQTELAAIFSDPSIKNLEELKELSDPFAVPDGNPETLEEYRKALVTTNLKYINFSEVLPLSETAPQMIYNNQNPDTGYGFVMFKGNLFSEGYFRTRSKHFSIQMLGLNQPWIELISTKNGCSLKYHAGDVDLVKYVLSHLADSEGNITLYSGAHESEYSTFLTARNDNKKIRAIKKTEVFLTSDLSVAFDWNKGIVEKLVIPKNVWNKWTKKNGIYVGYEHNYHEIAIYNHSVLDSKSANPFEFLVNNIEKISDEEFETLQNDKNTRDKNINTGGTIEISNPEALCSQEFSP